MTNMNDTNRLFDIAFPRLDGLDLVEMMEETNEEDEPMQVVLYVKGIGLLLEEPTIRSYYDLVPVHQYLDEGDLMIDHIKTHWIGDCLVIHAEYPTTA